MVSILLTGAFTGKAHFSHTISVPTAMLNKPGQEKVVGFEYLLRQYKNESFATLQNFKATILY